MQYEELQKKNSIMSYALNLWNRDVGIGNFVIFVNYLNTNYLQITISDLYSSRTQGMQQGTKNRFLSVELILNISKRFFFPQR